MKYILSLTLLAASLNFAEARSNSAKAAPTDSVYKKVDKLPEFPGGITGFSRFLSTSLRYPQRAFAKRIQGKVLAGMIVEKNGSISNIEVKRSSGNTDLDKEALRALSTSPKWKPGIQSGKPVRVAYTVPIHFTIK